MDFVDATDIENVADAMRDETAFVWMETPTNPLLRFCDIEAIAELPVGMTHEPLPKAGREAVGITDTLIRLSVGIEEPADLVGDLERGFDTVTEARQSTSTAVTHSQD